MAGPFKIACPICRTEFPVPAEIVGVNESTNHVLVQMDRTNLYGHMRVCAAQHHQAPPVPGASVVARREVPVPTTGELRGRIDRLLDMRAFIGTGGSRACTMCGVNGADCLAQMQTGEPGRASGVPCCAACGNGDTHPVPKGGMSCAEWGAEFGRREP